MSSAFNNCVKLTDKDKRQFIPEVVWLVLADSGRAKKYKDIIKLDGGTVGIAHFATGGLGGLYQKMGDALIQKYFGKTMTVQKMVDNYSSKCLPEEYAGKGQNDDGWGCYSGGHNPLGIDWRNGMTSFLNDVSNNKIQDEAVYTARVGAINDAIKNGWNLPFEWAVAIGISNSKGNAGFTSLAKRNGWDAEKTLNAYTSEKVSGHRNKRAELIRKFYPLCTGQPKESTNQGTGSQQQANNQPTPEVKPQVNPQQNQNQGTPIPQEKKTDDAQDVQTSSQTPSEQIYRIFKNTIVPQDIELVFKNTNRANQQIIAQTLGYAPVLFYNGLMIDSKDITLLTLTHEGLVPKLTAKITDSKGIFKSTSMPTDDTKISLFMNSRSSYLAPIRIDFKIIEFKFLTTSTFLITGIIDVPKLYTKFFASVPTSSSFDALQAIAKDCGLGFVTNIKETKDSQTWINTGLSYREFIKKIVDRSYISDESFQVCYIDYFYNLCYVDLSREFKRSIDNDVAVSCMGFDKLTEGVGKTQVDDQIIPMILTTERNSSTNVNFVEKFTELNNSTSISLAEGYRTNVGYLDKSKKELVQFKIEGQTSDPSKFMILKATSGDNEFYKNTKTTWYGKIDNQEDAGNTHANIGFAAASNKRNLLELIKLSARAYLPNYNFNLYPFRKVQIQVVLPSATLAQPAGFDVRLTGEWLITSMEFRWVGGATKMYVDLKKRDLSLSPEEKIQEPPRQVDQNNNKTQPNENAPNDPAKKTEVKPKESGPTIIIPDNEKFTGPTPKLKKAVQQQVAYTFNNASRWPYGRLTGGSYPWLCAGWTYNLAKHIIDALSKGDTYAFNKWGGAGNADDKSLRDALSKNGLYDEVLIGEIPYSKMFSTINSINWNYGEVAIYFSSYLTSKPVSGDPYKKEFRHAQIYTGDLFKDGDRLDKRKGRGWTTDRITNYGASFVYGSKAAAYTFKLYRFKIKNQYLI